MRLSQAPAAQALPPSVAPAGRRHQEEPSEVRQSYGLPARSAVNDGMVSQCWGRHQAPGSTSTTGVTLKEVLKRHRPTDFSVWLMVNLMMEYHGYSTYNYDYYYHYDSSTSCLQTLYWFCDESWWFDIFDQVSLLLNSKAVKQWDLQAGRNLEMPISNTYYCCHFNVVLLVLMMLIWLLYRLYSYHPGHCLAI